MGSIFDFLKRKDEQILAMEGKRGVVALRQQRDAIRNLHARHEQNLKEHHEARDDLQIKNTRNTIERLASTKISRDYYDAIVYPNVPERLATHPRLSHLAWASSAKHIIETAQDNKVLPNEYANFDRKGRGDCLNIDLYGYAEGLVLVQVRRTTVSKYGSSPRKSYFVTDGKNAIEVSKSKIRRAAQQLKDLDAPMRAVKDELPGEWAVRLGDKLKLAAPVASKSTGYKIVVRAANGKLVSAYDKQTEYKLGKQLKQKARDEHRGGYYIYADPDALRNNPTDYLNEDLIANQSLALLECECVGTPVKYGAKLAYSIVKPVRIVDEWFYAVGESNG